MSHSSPRNSFPSRDLSIDGKRSLSVSLRLVFLTTCVFVLALSAQAQTAHFSQGEAGTNTMSLQVPLGNYPGRGVSLPINLNYSSKVWRLGYLRRIYYTYGGSNTLAEAIYSEYATAGWTTSLDVPVIEWPKQNDCYWFTGKPYALGSVYPYTFRVAQMFIHMPDGSTHTLRKADQVYQDTGSVDMSGTFYAVDGSRMRYDSSGASTGTLYLADGTRYVFSAGTVQYIDRSGNTLSFNTSTRVWTDTLGRTIDMPWPANPQPIPERLSLCDARSRRNQHLHAEIQEPFPGVDCRFTPIETRRRLLSS